MEQLTTISKASTFPSEPPQKNFRFRARGHFLGLAPVFGRFGLVSDSLKVFQMTVLTFMTQRNSMIRRYLMIQTVPPTFIENGPKLKVLILMNQHKPKRAKNRGGPWKMTHSSETEIFSGRSNGNIVAPGIHEICSVDKNCDYQKIDSLPQISKFLGQKRQEGPKSYTPSPQNIGFLAKKQPNLAQNGHFQSNMSIFGPFAPTLTN